MAFCWPSAAATLRAAKAGRASQHTRAPESLATHGFGVRLRPITPARAPSAMAPLEVPRYDAVAPVPIRVDWKATFSAERTFMAWVHMGVTLMSIGFGLAASAWPATHATGLLLLVHDAAGLLLHVGASSRASKLVGQVPHCVGIGNMAEKPKP